jgi:very-short-patch-repair endonuclease
VVLNCEICKTPFESEKPRRTCGKECKRELQRQITRAQFADPESRRRHQKATVLAMQDIDLKSIIKSNRRSYKGENHPSYGVERDAEWRGNISKGNIGKLKGRSWDEILGQERAAKRRAENAEQMAKTNSRLINDRSSIPEARMATIFDEFERNKKVGRYVVDLIDECRKLIIEYNGGYWHADPRCYEPDTFIPSIGKTAKQKWASDAERLSYLQHKGYSVITLWSSDVDKMSDADVRKLVPCAG